MNQALNNLLMGLDSLRAHKLRTSLTILGIVIGTSTVIVISAFVSGINIRVEKEMQAWGTHSIWIYKFNPGFNFRPSREERMRKPLGEKEALAIKESCPSVREVSLVLSIIDLATMSADGGRLTKRIPLRYQDTEMRSGTLLGVWSNFERTGSVSLHEGRFFSEEENKRASRVCIIGMDVAETLFPSITAVGKEIQIDSTFFLVIGVLNKRDNFLVPDDAANNENTSVYIPYETCHKMYPQLDDHLILATAYQGKLDEAADEITYTLRRVRKVPFDQEDNFGIASSDQIIDQFKKITGGVFFIMVAISSVGLLVGGVGVMNMMLVSVTERTHEIGIRKAVGARQRDILLQFLIETIMLTGLGGWLGLLVGWLLSVAVKQFLPSYIPPLAPIAGFLVSIIIGLIFGLWPAIKASRLDPIEALRYE